MNVDPECQFINKTVPSTKVEPFWVDIEAKKKFQDWFDTSCYYK